MTKRFNADTKKRNIKTTLELFTNGKQNKTPVWFSITPLFVVKFGETPTVSDFPYSVLKSCVRRLKKFLLSSTLYIFIIMV